MSDQFVFIEDCKNDTIRIIKEINNKTEKLEEIYKEYLQEATKKEDHMMTLDILFFQIQLNLIDNFPLIYSHHVIQMQLHRMQITQVHMSPVFQHPP